MRGETSIARSHLEAARAFVFLLLLSPGCADGPGARDPDPPRRPAPPSTRDASPDQPPAGIAETRTDGPPGPVEVDADFAPSLLAVAPVLAPTLDPWRRRDDSLGALLVAARLESGRRAGLARLRLGDLRLERGELDEARRCWEKAAALDPDLAVAAECRAAALTGVRLPPAAPRLRVAWRRPGKLDPRLVAAAGDVLVLGAHDEALLLDARTGEVRRALTVEGRVEAVAAGEGLVAIADAERVRLLEPGGEPRRSFPLDRLPGAGPARGLALQDDALLLLRASPVESYATLVAIDLTTGAVRFRARVLATDGARRSMLATRPGRLAVATVDETALVELATGESTWVRAEDPERGKPERARFTATELRVTREEVVDAIDIVTGERRARLAPEAPPAGELEHDGAPRVLEVEPGLVVVASRAGLEVLVPR